MQLIDGFLRIVYALEDDKGLSLALKRLLRDNVEDGAERGEGLAECIYEGGDLDALI